MTTSEPANPLIVQSDHTVLVEVDSPRYEAARNELVRFAELVKSPEHIYTYQIISTPQKDKTIIKGVLNSLKKDFPAVIKNA